MAHSNLSPVSSTSAPSLYNYTTYTFGKALPWENRVWCNIKRRPRGGDLLGLPPTGRYFFTRVTRTKLVSAWGKLTSKPSPGSETLSSVSLRNVRRSSNEPPDSNETCTPRQPERRKLIRSQQAPMDSESVIKIRGISVVRMVTSP